MVDGIQTSGKLTFQLEIVPMLLGMDKAIGQFSLLVVVISREIVGIGAAVARSAGQSNGCSDTTHDALLCLAIYSFRGRTRSRALAFCCTDGVLSVW